MCDPAAARGHREPDRRLRRCGVRRGLEQARLEFETARRAGDLQRMSELQYGRIPELEKRLKQAVEAESAETTLLRNNVTDEEIASVVSKWTGIPVSKMLEGERDKLLRMEQEESHYLTFCAGGTIAWSAALRGLPMKSLLAVSPLWLHQQSETPHVPVKLMYGEYMDNRPSEAWAEQMGVQMEVVPRFGRELYSDEKIIQQVCQELLERIIQKKHSLPVMKPLSV